MWTCVCGSRGGEDNDSEACKDWDEHADKVLLQAADRYSGDWESFRLREQILKKCMQCKQTLMEADKSALKNHYQLDRTGHFWLRCHNIGNVILQNLQANTNQYDTTSNISCAHSKGITITMVACRTSAQTKSCHILLHGRGDLLVIATSVVALTCSLQRPLFSIDMD